VRIRAAYETDGEPDWNGQPVFWTKPQLEKKRRQMNSRYDWSCQMMNEPLPDEARMWPINCEDSMKMTVKEAALGPGVIVVLSDPAPANVGSAAGVGEKKRSDGSKDYWSLAVVRLRVYGNRLDRILLWGAHSQDWRTREGLLEAAKLMKKFGTRYFFEEYYGGAGSDNTEEMVSVCRQEGVTLYRKKDGRIPTFTALKKKNAKNLRFEALCDAARSGEFYICESVSESFLHGDREYSGFLTQARSWMALPNGKNSIRYDDDADIVAHGMDEALAKLAPNPDYEDFFNDDDEEEYESYAKRSRYCAA
jgi:hypothetical protein